MPSKDLHQEPFDEATITKLDIFSHYFEDWLPVFFKKFKRILVCDFFAGPGKDTQGRPGSPLRVLQTVKKFQKQIITNRMQVRIILNELDKAKFEQLESTVNSEIENLDPALREFIFVDFFSEPFQKLFQKLYDQFYKQPNLFFIDQNGIKEVVENIFQKIIALQRTDFLFFISSSSFRRFAKTDSFRKHHPDLDPELIKNAPHDKIHRIVLDYYRKKIPPENETKLYPFSLKKGRSIYGLIFGSKHLRGVEKFLKIVWKKNELNGEANYDIDDTEQRSLFPGKLSKIELFEHTLEKLISEKKKMTNLDIYHFALEEGHIPRHARDALVKLKKTGKVAYDGIIGCSYDSCCNPKKRNIKTVKWIANG